jgi:hypothetical protein
MYNKYIQILKVNKQKNLKLELLYGSAVLPLSIYPKELKAGLQTNIYTCIHSQQHYSQWPKGRSNPSVHGQMNR